MDHNLPDSNGIFDKANPWPGTISNSDPINSSISVLNLVSHLDCRERTEKLVAGIQCYSR